MEWGCTFYKHGVIFEVSSGALKSSLEGILGSAHVIPETLMEIPPVCTRGLIVNLIGK
jgi:hypothetical protein